MPAESSYISRNLVAVDGHDSSNNFGNAPIGIDTSGNVTLSGSISSPVGSSFGYFFGSSQFAVQSAAGYRSLRDNTNLHDRFVIGPDVSDPTNQYAATTHTFYDLAGNILITIDTNGYFGSNRMLSVSPTGGFGYATGAGGAITQASSRTTAVTLNKVAGAITLVSAAGSATPATFTVNNSVVNDTDIVVVNQKSGTDKYQLHVTKIVNATSFDITFNTTGGVTVEQPVFNFAIVRAATS